MEIKKLDTNFVDEIPKDGKRTYKITNDEDGQVIEKEVRIERSNKNEQEGSLFGAKQVNRTHQTVNELIDEVGTKQNKILTGNSAPSSSIGTEGSIYIQYE